MPTSEELYEEGMADGAAGKEPNVDRLALGASKLNSYERGYIASGAVLKKPAKQEG